MDKSWITEDRDTLKYELGVEQFLIFAEENASNPKRIPCPCVRCVNCKKMSIRVIRGHLYSNGFMVGYKNWIWHGEPTLSSCASAAGNYGPASNPPFVSETVDMCHAAFNEGDYDEESYEFNKFVEEAERPLFDNSEHTKLDSLVKLHNLKARFGLSDSCFEELLVTVGSLLPKDNVLPHTMYEAKKTLTNLGLEYEKIHACPNDCILYRKEYSDATSCPNCGVPRWKQMKDKSVKVGQPAKVLWYFPIIPRFKRLFKSPTTSEFLTWHDDKRTKDGHMRHPADSPAWKLVDYNWPEFASEPRNLRLALAADGINPHSSLSSRYSCWPVILVTYNLPPWLCMKRKFMMLSLLISGPKQPGNDIDIYLEPLIDDLRTLWEGVNEVYDAHTQEYFTLRAVLLWTINDFPAYGNLSGCTTKGYKACPICGDETSAVRLTHGRKMSYGSHRKFLPRHHPYRRMRKEFNNQQEFGSAPTPLTGEQVFKKVEHINCEFGKGKNNKNAGTSCMKKKSIFFNLEYWKFLHIRHALDVMHIEKNVCESLIGTLLNMPFKTKDSVAARLDLIEMGVRLELAPEIGEKRTYLPAAPFTLSRAEKIRMCSSFLSMKVPDGHSSNIKNLVSMDDLKLYGLKSHDCHTLMQQLLPVAIRSVLPKHVRTAIMRLCFFFNALCTKVVDVSKLGKLQSDLVVTLCELEKIFPPSFFDIMVHLTVHLVREVRLCGPVFYRWMYPFERFMKVLKGYVRNRYHPEGCIAESYIGEESVEFCSEYLKQCSAIGVPKGPGKLTTPLSAAKLVPIDEKLRDQAHLHVLSNNSEVDPYRNTHMRLVEQLYAGKKKSKKWLMSEHNRTFADWFESKVLHNHQSERVKKRKYPHRLSRKGYIGLEDELRKKNPEGGPIDRAIMWKKARERKNGQIDEELKPVLAEIDELLDKKEKGVLEVSGSDDVLTKALKTAEHTGRVRGVGGFVNPSTYFNIPKQKRVRITRAELLARDRERELELEETKKMLNERQEKMETQLLQKIAQLEALMTGKQAPESPIFPVSDKASQHTVKQGNQEYLDNRGDEKMEENIGDCEIVTHPQNKNLGSACELAVDTITNIVAFGTLLGDEFVNTAIHGVPMEEGSVRVSVDGVIQLDALLPFPVKDEMETVGQAVGSHVAWPKEFVILRGVSKKKKKKMVPPKSLFQPGELHPFVPSRCKLLYKHAKTIMTNTGMSIATKLNDSVFGFPRELYILTENVIDLLEMKWIGAGVIAAYIAHLHEILRERELLDTFAFVDPSATYQRHGSEIEKYLLERLKEGKADRIFFAPHNPGKHWILTIIWENEIYILDSMAKPIHYLGWENAVKNAVRTFNAETGRSQKQPTLKSLPWAAKSRKAYTQELLDEVRIDVADYMQNLL